MTPDEVLTLAREGHPKILAAIMNRSTQPHGITVRVAQKQDCLHILIEGAAIANSESLITFIEGSLRKLKVNPIYSVKVYGRQTGQKSVAWSQDIQIQPDATLSAQSQVTVNSSSDSSLADTNLNLDNQSSELRSSEAINLGIHSPLDNQAPAEDNEPAPLSDSEVHENLDTLDSDTAEEKHTEETPAEANIEAEISDGNTISQESDILHESASTKTEDVIDKPQDLETSSFATLDVSSPKTDALESPKILDVVADPWGLPTATTETLPESPIVSQSSFTTADMENEIKPATGTEKLAATGQPNEIGAVAFVQPTASTPADQASGVSITSDASSAADASADDAAIFDQDEPSVDFQSMMQRPEALVIILFAIVLYIWQLYNALAQAAAPEGSVSSRELAERLGVSKSTISRRRLEADFAEWSASQDPDGIAWAYSDGAFVPQMPDFNAA